MATRKLIDSKTPIPLIVIGGFLGSGKTTLINQLLSEATTPRCAIVVNDFGDINIDSKLIEYKDDNIIALKNGCVCCSMANDLTQTLSQIVNFTIRPEKILIEASGVSLPKKIADVAKISADFLPAGVCVLADSIALERQLKDRWIADTVELQLQSANAIILSKTNSNNLSIDYIDQLKILMQLNPGAEIYASDSFTWSILNDVKANTHAAISTKQHASFTTIVIESNRRVNWQTLENWMSSSEQIYRVKGWLKDANTGDNFLIQATPENIEISATEQWFEKQIAIVVIGIGTIPTAQQILDEICYQKLNQPSI